MNAHTTTERNHGLGSGKSLSSIGTPAAEQLLALAVTANVPVTLWGGGDSYWGSREHLAHCGLASDTPVTVVNVANIQPEELIVGVTR